MSESPAQPTRTDEYFQHRQARSGAAGSAAMSPSDNPLPEAIRTVAGADSVRATIVNHTGPAGLVTPFFSVLCAHSRQRDARNLPAGSESARELFGEDGVVHCVHYADVEPAAVEAAVTDRELRRDVERL